MRRYLPTVAMMVAALGVTLMAAKLLESSARVDAQRKAHPAPAVSADRYIGEYRNGKFHGRGTLHYANGETYVGEFRDGVRNGQGTYTWPDGRRYVGEFRNGQPNGQGTYRFANGEVYAGFFRDNRREGHGVYSWPDHRRYEGQFRDDQPNGRGELTHANGRRQIGLFSNGAYVGEGTAPPPAAAALTGPAAESSTVRHRTEVELRRNGVNFTTPVLINGAIECEFFIDSGAADVFIPMNVFDAMFKAGTVAREDVTGTETYRMADGSNLKSVTLLIRTLKIGSIVLENIRGSVGERSGPALLGMSFLSRFKSWTLDNERHVLILN